MPPDSLAELEARKVWGTWDWHNGNHLIKRFFPVPGEGGPSTRKLAEWSLIHQLTTDTAGFQHRRAGLAVQLGPEDMERFKAALEAQGVEVFSL
jgi:hypothetical protein